MDRTAFHGQRMVILGFGAIGVAVLPLLLRHVDVTPERLLVLSDDDRFGALRRSYGVSHELFRLTPENFAGKLAELLLPGDCLINLTEGVASGDLVRFCLENGIDYIDTSNEQWPEKISGIAPLDCAELRSQLIRDRLNLPRTATALISHGANPGLVNHFVKQAIEDLARRERLWIREEKIPKDNWADLARSLEIQAIHIVERDTQFSNAPRDPGELVNTWSLEGMLEEAFEKACFAWGSHEPNKGSATTRDDGFCSVAQFPQVSWDFLVRSWLPDTGTFIAPAIPHEETFSLAALLRSTDPVSGVIYQPTVLFAYQPCDLALASLWCRPYLGEEAPKRVLIDEIAGGSDQLGILLLRRGRREIYWYGSTLPVAEARRHAPFCNATTLQVAAGLVGGLAWILENSEQGLVEPEDLDHRRVLEVAAPYLGELKAIGVDWVDAPPAWTIENLSQTA